jgi:Icc-related predicted phosphoesterase
LAKVTIVFASDFHGSEVVWRKFLNSAAIFKADWLIMGGDLTGKILIPIIRQPDGTYKSDFLTQTHTVPSEQVDDFKRKPACVAD